MSEETKPVEEIQETKPQGGESSEVKGILHDLQAERAKRQGFEQELAAIKLANEEAETARLAEQNKFQELYEAEKLKVAEYVPIVEQHNKYVSDRKAVLLEQLGDDAADFDGLDIPALEKVVSKLTSLSSPPKEPGKPGMTPSGDFGGYDSMNDLALAVARGVPGAREIYDKKQAGF